jgi:NAD(P)-dependent dehydrogenase (short-subunit alcohol dehydrogenase family)
MSKPGWDLSGRTVFITGPARGIGAECARRLATRGAQVALAGLEPEELERVASQCGPGAACFDCDVTDAGSVQGAVEGAVERFGGIDCVIANAGIAPTGMVRSIDPAAFEATIDVNLLGVFRSVRACLPQVIERRGYVLVIASMAAPLHAPGMSAYAAAKAGAEAFGNSLRTEVKHLGVDVGVAYFGFIDTDMVRGGDAHPVFGRVRDKLGGPLGKAYPVSAVGEAVLAGIEQRRRWIVVPPWAHAILLLRGLLQPVADLGGRKEVPEMDRSFAAYVAEHGTEAASAPVGRGGDAMRERSAGRT